MRKPPIMYVQGARIVIKNYLERKDEIDEFCIRYMVGYEIRRNGSAVIICD